MHLMKFTLWLTLIALLIISCRQPSQEAMWEEVRAGKTEQERISAAGAYLAAFPGGEKRDQAYLQLFRDYLELGNTERALEAAHHYTRHFPDASRMMPYNRIAWSLAEEGVGLDSAEVYARRALEIANEIGARQLSYIQDTYAYVLHQSGDSQQAEEMQKKALAGNEDNPGFLSRLADYQYANNKTQEALETLARAILAGAGQSAITEFKSWSAELTPSQVDNITNTLIDEYLAEHERAENRGRAAILLAASGTDMTRAVAWAREAVTAVQGDARKKMNAHMYLAMVYDIQNEPEKMLRALIDVQEQAMPYDQDFWLLLGKAYDRTGAPQPALDAYISGMIWEDTAALMSLAEKYASRDVILQRIDSIKSELMDFHPGNGESDETRSDETVLVELFTGAECPPCTGADLAMDLIAEYYPRSRVVLMEYHLHIPGPDPMTNPSAWDRYVYYGHDFGTPTVFIQGTEKLTGGGPELVKKHLFERYRRTIESISFEPAPVPITCQIEKMSDGIAYRVSFTGHGTEMSNVQVYSALLEKTVDYAGSNNITKHAFVVREVTEPRTVSLGQGEASVRFEMDFSAVEDTLNNYLDEFAASPPDRFKYFSGWRARPTDMDRRDLALAVWVQDLETKRVVAALYEEI